jgi:hypothetical protein
MSINLIHRAIEEYGILPDIGGVPGRECAGSKFHSPTPLACVQVDLADLFVALTDDGADPLWVCPNCLLNLRIFVLLLIASGGSLPWETRRQFGNLIRELGARTWECYYKEQAS